MVGVTTYHPEEPYANSARTVLWEALGVSRAPTRLFQVLMESISTRPRRRPPSSEELTRPRPSARAVFMRVYNESLPQGGNNRIVFSTGKQSNANWNNYDLAQKRVDCNRLVIK